MSVSKEIIQMEPCSTNPTLAKIPFLQDVKDPAWVSAGLGPPAPPQLSKASIHYMPVRDISANLNERAVAVELYAVAEDMVPSAAGGWIAEVQPLSDAPPASSYYGPVAPAWVQRHPRMILTWACLRALRWLLRDFWRAFISYLR